MVERTPDDLESQAARWFVRWDDGSQTPGTREQSRWISWLQRSPQNVSEYFAVDDLCARLGESAALKNFDVDAWMADRRAPVARLHTPGVAQRSVRIYAIEARGRPRRRRWLVAASAAVVAVGLISFWALSGLSQSYTTGLGEQKTVHLADGSLIQLNTQSRAHVAFSQRDREILLEGEALFSVAADKHRPFVVRTHDARIQAIGTRFNVYEQGRATRVAVLEGRVRVFSNKSDQSLDLGVGEEAEVANGYARKESQPNVKAAVSWQSQTLVFERTRIADVAHEFNRYNTMQFRVDPTMSDVNRLSGTFDARHPESLLLWLQSRPDLSVVRDGAVYVIRENAR